MSTPKLRIGQSNRLSYETQAYADRLAESTGPLGYRLNPQSRYNCGQCLSVFGPRTSLMGNSVSTTVGHPVATSQRLVDVESILSNRNVKTSKARRDQVNPINVLDMPQQNLGQCSEFLNPMSSRLMYPVANYRDVAMNRFYNLTKNPQVNIFYDFAVNTKLEAKDNFDPDIPQPWPDNVGPYPLPCDNQNNVIRIPYDAYCNQPGGRCNRKP